MKKRLITSLAALAAMSILAAPGAIAADLTDVGFIDQATIGSMPQFVNANGALAQYKQQLDAQFADAMKNAKSDADKQSITMKFQQQFADKQRELVGPIYTRAQYAIASVAGDKKLSIVVDKRIVVYGGVDITKDVQALIQSNQAVNPPASPAPSSIGFVDQQALQNSSKVKSASDDFQKYADDQRKQFAAQAAAAKTDADKQKIAADFNKTLQAKQEQLLKPLLDQTKDATASVAKQKNLVLVVDHADVVFGGTDITTDVQNALNK